MEWTTKVCQKLENIRYFQQKKKYFTCFHFGQLIKLVK